MDFTSLEPLVLVVSSQMLCNRCMHSAARGLCKHNYKYKYSMCTTAGRDQPSNGRKLVKSMPGAVPASGKW